jgi:NAD(P)-dependent dehydrogenase (short-subunit alcohol dehydrogenase family)
MGNRNSFGADTTADEVLEGIDLTGKRVLITGASGGLGAETARAMAAKGAEVIVTARNLDKVQGVVQAIAASTGATIEVGELELGSFASVRRFAEQFLARHPRLDYLINNAGVMACPEGKTEDGIELQFGANHLGHFLLCNLFAPALVEGGRIVSVSSLAHHASPVVFEDIQFARRPYEKWSAYGQSKTANALFAVGINTRLNKRGIEAFSLHPGAIETDLTRHHSDADRARSRAAREAGLIKFKSIPAGAATSVYAATAPELAGKGGAYLADCAIQPIVEASSDVRRGVRAYAVDPALAEQLWTVSEELVGQRFAF